MTTLIFEDDHIHIDQLCFLFERAEKEHDLYYITFLMFFFVFFKYYA